MSKTIFKIPFLLVSAVILIFSCNIYGNCNAPGMTPVRVFAGLNIGESRKIKLSNGDVVELSLLEIKVIRDSLRNGVRAAIIKVSVDGAKTTLNMGNYNLPVVIGKIQIDCPIIKDNNLNSPNTKDLDPLLTSQRANKWDALFRLWPKGSPYINPGTFGYPIRQKWFASLTQSGNEPTYVDWGEDPTNKGVYYHKGHDIGGAESMDEVLAATDGLVISANGKILKGYDEEKLRGMDWTDAIYIVDDRGWYYEYCHLDSTDPLINPGVKVKMGQRIGIIGKQGTSGGWVHLHFEIKNKDNPSGKWDTEDAYAYCWEAYMKQYNPPLVAVARPHQFICSGQEATFDGGKSKSNAGKIISYEWTFSDGTTAKGAVQKKTYKKPGEYSEILKVTDSKGNVDYDFTVVQVSNKKNPEKLFPTLQAAYHPTLDIKPGTPITFLVRTFNSEVNNEVWNFGDGSPYAFVKSEVNRKEKTKGKFAQVVHSFSKPGHYIVTVERANEYGYKALGHLQIVVNK